MNNIGMSAVMAKTTSCATSLLRAIINLLNLSFMLIWFVHDVCVEYIIHFKRLGEITCVYANLVI